MWNSPLLLMLCVYLCCVSERMGEPDVVEQVDLTPTLALALSLPISQNSVGRLIPAVFEKASIREKLRYLHINGHQLSNLLRDSNPSFQKGENINTVYNIPQHTQHTYRELERSLDVNTLFGWTDTNTNKRRTIIFLFKKACKEAHHIETRSEQGPHRTQLKCLMVRRFLF